MDPRWERAISVLMEGRPYHNVGHVRTLLSLLDEFGPALLDQERLCVELAIWFHDAIYVPGAKTNEEHSAHLFTIAAEALDLPWAFRIPVVDMIRATVNHKHSPKAPIAHQWFLDADQSILGSSEGEYDAYAKAIRLEYGEVPDDLYREGRLKFLLGMLARKRIFVTPFFGAYEARARTNMVREIETLGRPA